ncbi:hypothetical protein EV122DRAFT_258755 [Schizophyllum commune]|nr:uncharacterized protein SCHCODRAFT_02625504 [Schizophyllum commune H4-8]KAI5828612.1 hypothetical protein K523DRAFT_276437 [Schizophyllum commune Tattone D]KAI5892172.1 hypothetical protein SCHCODRAFT_02625504 [Schizophyllum commune H4-8]
MSNEDVKAAIKAKYEERDNIIREQWVKAMEARIVREELQKCHRAEGVNQQENCKWLAEKYLEKLEGSRIKGYKTVDA